MSNDEEILRTRAAILAQQLQDDQSVEDDHLELLEFMLSEERYAIETPFVKEAFTIQELTPIPGTPPFLSGVMNVRGQIIPVVDLKELFGIRKEGIISSSKTLILENEGYEIAILADSISSMARIHESSINTVPSTVHGIGAEHLRGVTSDALIVIEGKSLLKKLESSLKKE